MRIMTVLQDIVLFCDHESTYISKHKHDQYRVGPTILLAKSGKCPVMITARLLKCLEGSSPNSPLIRRKVKSKS